MPLAPGFWRCQSVVTVWGSRLGPAPGTPPQLGIEVPLPTSWQEICGYEYHEAGAVGTTSATPACSCGTFAIGRCDSCGRPVCGYHSALRATKRLCTAHAEDYDRAAQDRRTDEARREVWSRWSPLVAELAEEGAGLQDHDMRALLFAAARQGPLAAFLDATSGQGGPTSTNKVDAETATALLADLRGLIRRLVDPTQVSILDTAAQDPANWVIDDQRLGYWLCQQPEVAVKDLKVMEYRSGWIISDFTKVGMTRGVRIDAPTILHAGKPYQSLSTTPAYVLVTGQVVPVSEHFEKLGQVHPKNNGRMMTLLDLVGIAATVGIRLPGIS